jgi:hypothetical protein
MRNETTHRENCINEIVGVFISVQYPTVEHEGDCCRCQFGILTLGDGFWRSILACDCAEHSSVPIGALRIHIEISFKVLILVHAAAFSVEFLPKGEIYGIYQGMRPVLTVLWSL